MKSTENDVSTWQAWGARMIKPTALVLLGVLFGTLAAVVFTNPVQFKGASISSKDVFVVAKRQHGGSSVSQGAAGGAVAAQQGNTPRTTSKGPTASAKPASGQHLEYLEDMLHEVQQELHSIKQQQVQQKQAPVSSSIWPTDSTDPTGSTCRDGFLAGPRTLFWPYMDDNSPGLTDILHAEDRVYVVFNMRLSSPHREKWNEKLLAGNWSISFTAAKGVALPSKTAKAYEIGRDSHTHTFSITVPLPDEFATHPRDRSVRVNVTLQHGELTRRYDNVPLCLRPELSQYRHLVACTEITADSAASVPEWVAYHSLQGIEQFYIYVNDELHLVRQHLERLVKAGLVTVVDWRWPDRYKGQHMFQQTEQNGCLMRQRGQARWVVLHDVDEFIQPLQPGMTMAEFLNQRNVLDWVGTLIVHAVFWGSNTNDTVQANFTQASGGLVLEKIRTRTKCCEGQKMIANPRGMSYSSVHGITTGGPEHVLDSAKEMRLNHFKAHQKYDILDDSLFMQVGFVRSRLQQLGYPSS